jgi:hypothetical protein
MSIRHIRFIVSLPARSGFYELWAMRLEIRLEPSLEDVHPLEFDVVMVWLAEFFAEGAIMRITCALASR